MNYTDFKIKVTKIREKKGPSKITNSNGVKEAWRWLRKNKWLNLGQPITELELGTIIKAINQTLQDQLLEGKDVRLPNKMGRLEVRKFHDKLQYENGKIITNLPIDWERTLHLWWEDEESHKAKTLVRYEACERFLIYLNKTYAHFTNKEFYKFTPTRSFKKRFRNKIVNKQLDAFLL
jgi:hypothetical protein